MDLDAARGALDQKANVLRAALVQEVDKYERRLRELRSESGGPSHRSFVNMLLRRITAHIRESRALADSHDVFFEDSSEQVVRLPKCVERYIEDLWNGLASQFKLVLDGTECIIRLHKRFNSRGEDGKRFPMVLLTRGEEEFIVARRDPHLDPQAWSAGSSPSHFSFTPPSEIREEGYLLEYGCPLIGDLVEEDQKFRSGHRKTSVKILNPKALSSVLSKISGQPCEVGHEVLAVDRNSFHVYLIFHIRDQEEVYQVGYYERA